MLRLPRSIRVFVATAPISPGTSVDGLVQIVRDRFGEDPFTGNLFCFFNRRRDWVKLLMWDRNGFWVMGKRLERGRFEPVVGPAPVIEFDRERAVMLLSGIDTVTSRFRRYFAREVRITSRDDDARPARAAQ